MHGHDRLHALDIGDPIHGFVVPADRAHDAQIVHVRRIEIDIHGLLHVRRGHAEPGIEARTERGDHGDGDEPARAMRDRSNEFREKRAGHGVAATIRWCWRAADARSSRRRPHALP